MPRLDPDPARYASQLSKKADRLQALFAPFEMPSLEVFDSPPLHHRMRAEFRVWHDQDDLYYIMFDPQTKQKYRIDRFPIASQLINDLMPALIGAIRGNSVLRRKLFQIDFLSTLSGDILASLLYHRPLDEAWTTQAKALRQSLRDAGFRLDLIGRARKLKVTLDRDYVIEQLRVGASVYTYQQRENSFTQPNAAVAEKMLAWAVDCTRQSTGDLLELYCGNAHFSLAMAPNFDKVLATEVAKSSVQSARYNITANSTSNVQVVRLSAEEVAAAMDGVREFRRLKSANIDLGSYRFQTVFVDPPRSGMDRKSCTMVQRFDRILYISCNPTTLRENLDQLCETHMVSRFALFDQFPYTHHIEAGVLLERR